MRMIREKRGRARPLAACLALLLAFAALLGACGGGDEGTSPPGETAATEGTEGAAGEAATVAATPTPNRELDPATERVGLLMGEEAGILAYAAEHGFLRTAENYGYPAKLYTAFTSEEAALRVDEAIADGCVGLLVWADSPEMLTAVEKARAHGIKVVVPYEKVGEGVADANLAPDVQDYCGEAARILCERIKSRDKTEGTIFVTGSAEHPEIAQAFAEAVGEQYPEFDVVNYLGEGSQEAVNAFVTDHPEMVAVLALEEGSGLVWNDSCNQVQAQLKKEMEEAAAAAAAEEERLAQAAANASASPGSTPSPTPTPTPTPSPTATDGAAEEESYRRYANILVLDYTPENVDLVRRGVVTGMIARPFYDSTAQSMAVLDSLLRNLPIQTEVRLNTPIIRKETVAKYKGIMDEVEAWFAGKETPAPSEEPSPSPVEENPSPSATVTPTADGEGVASPTGQEMIPSASAGETTPATTSDPLPSALLGGED